MSDSVATADTPPQTATGPNVLGSLSDGERSHWRLTGELPSKTTSAVEDRAPAHDSTEADSSPAAPAAQGTSTEVSPAASEPATPKKANAETRIKELLEENKRLKAERAEMQSAPPRLPVSDANPATSSTAAPAKDSIHSVIQSPDLTRPALTDAEFYTQFPEASVGDFVRYSARHEALSLERERSHAQSAESRKASYGQAWENAVKARPDLVETLPAAVMNALPVDLLAPGVQAGPWHWANHEILNSGKAGALYAHLIDHPELVQQITQHRNPIETIRTIARLEATLDTPSVTPQTTAKAVTSAPSPPDTLGRRPSVAVDEVAAAVAAKDARRYISEMNRRDIEAAR